MEQETESELYAQCAGSLPYAWVHVYPAFWHATSSVYGGRSSAQFCETTELPSVHVANLPQARSSPQPAKVAGALPATLWLAHAVGPESVQLGSHMLGWSLHALATPSGARYALDQKPDMIGWLCARLYQPK